VVLPSTQASQPKEITKLLDMHLMSYELSQEKLKTFARGATHYDLVEPIIRVAGGGRVERV
jgi:hypothetical protein